MRYAVCATLCCVYGRYAVGGDDFMACIVKITAMRNAMFGLVVAVAVSIGTGIAIMLLVLIAVALGVAP